MHDQTNAKSKRHFDAALTYYVKTELTELVPNHFDKEELKSKLPDSAANARKEGRHRSDARCESRNDQAGRETQGSVGRAGGECTLSQNVPHNIATYKDKLVQMCHLFDRLCSSFLPNLAT